jgi:uncharacterized protein (DUF488 family)
VIFSIGHGNKELQRFMTELTKFGVEYVVDVRSSPYSKYNSQFNREELARELKMVNIKYVYMGDNLGGLPSDRSCYIDGKVDYDAVKQKPFFKEGLERIVTANEKQLRVAIMCSETKPEECHRSKLIGQELLKQQIVVQHITESATIKDQVTLMNELTKGQGTVDLFGDEVSFTSRKRYG